MKKTSLTPLPLDYNAWLADLRDLIGSRYSCRRISRKSGFIVRSVGEFSIAKSGKVECNIIRFAIR